MLTESNLRLCDVCGSNRFRRDAPAQADIVVDVDGATVEHKLLILNQNHIFDSG